MMDAYPLISAIIPAYNSGRTVERAVRSVLSQSYPNVEVIVVNDGSRDDTEECVRRIMAEDGRVRLINKTNAGVSAARNDGIDAASGVWFMTLDADDYIDREMLIRLYETAADHEADTVLCGFRFVFPDGRKTAFRAPTDYVDERREFLEHAFVTLYDLHLISTHSNQLYNTALVRKHRIYYDERLAVNEDIDFVLRYLTVCDTIAVIRGVYLNYVQQETGTSLNTTFQTYGVKSALWIEEDMRHLLDSANISRRTENRIQNRMFMHICSFLGLMYYRSDYSSEEKLREIENLSGDADFRRLLHSMRPEGVKNAMAWILLSLRWADAYHLLSSLLYFRHGKRKQKNRSGSGACDTAKPNFAYSEDGVDLQLIEAALREGAEEAGAAAESGRLQESAEEALGAPLVTVSDMRKIREMTADFRNNQPQN